MMDTFFERIVVTFSLFNIILTIFIFLKKDCNLKYETTFQILILCFPDMYLSSIKVLLNFTYKTVFGALLETKAVPFYYIIKII